MTGWTQDVKFEDRLSEVDKAAWISLKNITTIFGGEIITQKINVIRISTTWKRGTKACGIPVWWLIIAGHLKETFYRQHVTESLPLVLFLSIVCTLCTASWMAWVSNPGEGKIYHTCPDRTSAHPASYTMCTGSFPGVQRPGWGVDHPPTSCLAPRLKKE
jgi:hypothetical protein